LRACEHGASGDGPLLVCLNPRYTDAVGLWLLELFTGVELVFLAVRYLPAFLERCSPRVWRESTLPEESSDEIDALTIIAVIAVVSVILSAFIIPAVYFSELFVLRGVFYLFLFLIAYALWAFIMRQRWWKLESACPLRISLDVISQKTGISLGKVRLRDGNAGIPRVFLDGSIEPTTGFFRDLPRDQQESLLVLALWRKNNNAVFKEILHLLVSFVFVLFILMAIYAVSNYFGFDVTFFVFGVPTGIVLSKLLSLPALPDESLRFALDHTGNFEVAAECVRRFDSKNADARLEKLRVWWDAQPKNVTSVPTASVVSSATAPTQALGRRP
jgi:hypothetical protein